MNKDRVKVVLKDGAAKAQVATGKVMGSTEQPIKGIKKVDRKTRKAGGDIKEVVKEAGRK